MSTLVVLIGPVGCGKTIMAKTLETLEFYRVSQDDQGRHEHFNVFTRLIIEGKSIVIDRMNFSRKQRMRYVEPARAEGYKIRFILFGTDRDTCLARIKTRQNHPTIGPDSDHEKILDFFYKQFEFPQNDEYDHLEKTDDYN